MPRNKPIEGESKTVILNESDSALDAFCMSRGTSIVFIDEQLAALPDDNVNKRELMRLRARVEDAHRRKDSEALDGWLHALIIGLKAACHTIPLATFAKPFKEHSNKSRKKSVIRKAIERELKKNSELMPRHIWDILKKNPPRGFQFFDDNLGKRIEGPSEKDDMTYKQFSEKCKDEKDNLKA